MNGNFGRIPVETVQFCQRSVKDVQERVISVLPEEATEELRAFTLEKVLNVVFRDWHEHGNDSLSDDDIADLSSFVQMAASLAGSSLNETGKPIYEATLQGLLEDWLYNWEPDEAE